VDRAARIAALITVAAAVNSGVAASAPHPERDSSSSIIVSDVSELQEALVPANAGRRITVRHGTYRVSSPLVVPDGASLVGEGVMLGDDLPTGFSPGTETTIQALPAFSGDVLTLGNNSSLRNLVVEDSAGRSGNVIGERSRGPGDTISASISECEIVTPNPAGVTFDGPTGRAVAVITQNPNLADAPPAHDGANLALSITRSIVRAPARGSALFAVNFASYTQISLELRENVFVGALDANGGVPRPETVSFASTTLDSRGNSYISNDLPAWRLLGGGSAPLAIASAATVSSGLSMDSRDDRVEAPSIGIFAIGGRRLRTIDGPASNNTVNLHIRGLTLRTASFDSSDVVLAGAQSSGEFPPGDDNTLTLDIRDSTGSGQRLNVYANTLGPLLPENFGVGNALLVAGTPEAFAERNPGIVPVPSAEFFLG
jgi:hypothetical protein